MLTIITDYNNNQEMFKQYWMPLILKHPECEFIFTKWTWERNIVGLKTYTCSREEAIIYSNNEMILLNEMHAVPTYSTMIYLTSLKDENICCNPIWHDYMPSSRAGQKSNSFTIKKSLFNTPVTMEEYISTNNAKVVNNVSLYYIENTK